MGLGLPNMVVEDVCQFDLELLLFVLFRILRNLGSQELEEQDGQLGGEFWIPEWNAALIGMEYQWQDVLVQWLGSLSVSTEGNGLVEQVYAEVYLHVQQVVVSQSFLFVLPNHLFHVLEVHRV